MIDREQLESAVRDAEPPELFALAGELQGRAFRAHADPPPSPPEDTLLTMSEVARRLGVKEGQARDLGRRGELPIVTVGRYVRVRLASLQEWMATREGGGVPTRRAG